MPKSYFLAMDVKNNICFMICVILFSSFSPTSHLSLAADKISAGQSLTGDQIISSQGGKYALGFFQPGNSPSYYIGIWYKNISPQTVVWVANRENPVSDKYSSELTISNGNLVLFYKGSVLWSTYVSFVNSSSTEAVLVDNGNLVLRDGSNLSEPLWQSFDHPGDTLLPGCRIGINKITKRSIRLTSWKNKEDPSPGIFSYELDPNGTSQYFILQNRSKIVWTTGTWNDNYFSFTPEMRLDLLLNYSYVDNYNGSYYTYSPYDTSTIAHFQISDEGQYQDLHRWPGGWNVVWYRPQAKCDLYAFCGVFSTCLQTSPLRLCHCLEGFHPKSKTEWNRGVYSAGCSRENSLRCRNSTHINGKSSMFLPSDRMLLPLDPQKVAVGNAQECQSACLNNCSCTAYAYYNNDCSIWHGDLLNLRQLPPDNLNGQTLYVRVSASNSSLNKGIPIGIAVASTITLLFLCGSLLTILRKRTRRRKLGKRDKAWGSMPENNGEPVFFSLESILAATEDFSQANKLGEGGFGPVYKGNFPGNKQTAIKRLSKKSGQGLEEFMNEVKLIGNLQHKYLVRLLGYCIEKDENILIYEYMANRSLDKFLFDPSEREKLSWDKRHKIVLGVAQGLLYIHQYSRLKVIHRDLKASNILLDEAMNPKISDFGMARIFGINQTEANTDRVMGTRGYISPEYAFSGQFSEKSDVFSFGVLLLEIVTAKRNTNFHRNGLVFTLLSWAWELWKEGKEAELIDTSMKGACSLEEALKCIHVGLLCVQEDPIDRPTMSLAVLMLSSDGQILPLPKEPAFLTRKTVVDSSKQRVSDNEMTLTLPTGR